MPRPAPLAPPPLTQGVSKASRRDRVAAKFVENEFEKCDRLMELFFRYRGRVGAEERRWVTHPACCLSMELKVLLCMVRPVV